MAVRENLPPTVQYMGICLTIQSGVPGDPYQQPRDVFPRDKAGGVIIGRSPSSDLQLDHPDVSSMHCRIEAVQGTYYLEDAQSLNGTFLGDDRYQLKPGQRIALQDGSTIHIAHFSIGFRVGLSSVVPLEQLPSFSEPVEEVLDSTAQLNQDVARSLMNDADARPPQLKIIAGDQTGRVFDLMEYVDFTIGRGEDCHLRLQDDSLSRKHAMIRRDWSSVTIQDLNSRNGVQVNRRSLIPGVEQTLSHGDQISLGLCTLVFQDPFAASLESKLAGVVVDGDDIDGATLLPDHLASKPTPGSAKDIDIREPVSGKWRVPKRPKKEEAPKPQPTPQPKPAATPKPAAAPKPTAPKPTPASAPAPKPSQQAPKPPPSSSNTLMAVGVVLACILVIVLALVLAFLL